MDNRKSEDEILEDLRNRGIARPAPTYDTASDPCPMCDEAIPENSHTTLNLGLSDYCLLSCRLEAEDDERGEKS